MAFLAAGESSEIQTGVSAKFRHLEVLAKLTTHIFSTQSCLANLINFAPVIDATSRPWRVTGDLLGSGDLDIDVGPEILVKGEEPLPDLVGINAIPVQMFLDKDIGDGR